MLSFSICCCVTCFFSHFKKSSRTEQSRPTASLSQINKSESIFNRLDEITNWAKSVVTGHHSAFGILHPIAEKTATDLRQCLDKLVHAPPGNRAKPFGLLCVFGDKNRSDHHITGVFHGIFIFLHQIVVLCPLHNRDPDLKHPAPRLQAHPCPCAFWGAPFHPQHSRS